MRLKMVNPITLFFTMMFKLMIGFSNLMAKMLYEIFKFLVHMWKMLLIGMVQVVRQMLGGKRFTIRKFRLTRKREV